MNTKIAFCGLACDSCPIFLSTKETDIIKKHAIKESVAQQLFEHYKIVLQPEDINDCFGCQANESKMFNGCTNCEIRVCALGRKADSCALCGDYPCDILTEHFLKYPNAKTRLEEIRNGNT